MVNRRSSCAPLGTKDKILVISPHWYIQSLVSTSSTSTASSNNSCTTSLSVQRKGTSLPTQYFSALSHHFGSKVASPVLGSMNLFHQDHMQADAPHVHHESSHSPHARMPVQHLQVPLACAAALDSHRATLAVLSPGPSQCPLPHTVAGRSGMHDTITVSLDPYSHPTEKKKDLLYQLFGSSGHASWSHRCTYSQTLWGHICPR